MGNAKTNRSASWADRETSAEAGAKLPAMATGMGRVSSGLFRSPEQVHLDRLQRRRKRRWAKDAAAVQNAPTETDAEGAPFEVFRGAASDSVVDRTRDDDHAELSPQVTNLIAETGVPKALASSVSEGDEEITRLVGAAREEAQKVGDVQGRASEKIESLTGAVVFHLKRVTERFEDQHGSVSEADLTAYLDRQRVPCDKRDRHIFVRVARLLKNQIKPGPRNKIGNNLAGANLLGIRSSQLPDTYKQGIQVEGRKARSTGPSALGAAYKAHLKAQKSQASGGRGAEAVPPRSASACASLSETIRTLSDGLGSGEITLHFRDRNSRLVKIAQMEETDEGIVFIEAA